MNGWRDPFKGSLAVLAGTVIAGFVLVAVASRSVAATANVATQVAYVVSGGFGGLALIGFGLGLGLVQVRRRDAARQMAAIRRLAEAIALRVERSS